MDWTPEKIGKISATWQTAQMVWKLILVYA